MRRPNVRYFRPRNPRPRHNRHYKGFVIDTFIDELAMEGLADNEVSVEGSASYAKVELGTRWLPLIEEIATNVYGDRLLDEERDFIASKAGAIVKLDVDGFVTVAYYDSEPDLEAKWKEIEEWAKQFPDDMVFIR